MYTVTGASDMQLRLVAHSAEQLQEVLDRIALALGSLAPPARSRCARTSADGCCRSWSTPRG
jgi:Lrp/AsnC family transcriptional regulator for asnA, asnC and gidA